jgi:predicted dehydrogenase
MYSSKKELGGGVLLTQIHELDYAMDLFGLPHSVYALGGHFSSLEVDVEDVADVLMEFPYKKRPLPVFLHMDFLQRPTSRKCRVIGEKGTVVMDLVSQNVVFTDTEGRQEKVDNSDFQRNELYIREIRQFFECIRKKEEPVVDVATAYQGMIVAMKIKESMERRKKIQLELPRREWSHIIRKGK